MKFSRNTIMGLAIVVMAVTAVGILWPQTPAIPVIQVEAVWSRPVLMAKIDHMAGMTSTQTTTDTMAGMAGMTSTQTTDDEMAGMEMGSRGVVYLNLLNKGGTPDRLIGVQSDVADHTELHETIMEADGLMKMRPVEGGIEIPAGGQAALKPGSYHIMLMGLKQDLKVGDHFSVVLTFEQSEPMTVESEVMEQ